MGDVLEGIMLLGKILEILEKRALCCCKNNFEKMKNFHCFPHNIAHALFRMKISKMFHRASKVGGGTDSVPREIQYTVQK